MKKIFKVLFGVLLVVLILYVYCNIEEITDFTIKYFTEKKEVIIPDKNEYKRNYTYQRFEISDNYMPLNKDDLENIYFNILNNGFNEITFYCPSEYLTCIEDIKSISNDNELISKINNYVSPYNSFSYLDTSITEYGEITLTVHKTYSDSEINELNNIINIVLSDLKLDNLKDIDKIRKIKDYLIDNVEYDEGFVESVNDNPSTKATGALINKKAVCSGYSDAMALFLDKIKIPNIKVSSENHIWNLVYINNNWKHLDITWSDTDDKIDLKDKFLAISSEELLEIDKEEHNFDRGFYLEAN